MRGGRPGWAALALIAVAGCASGGGGGGGGSSSSSSSGASSSSGSSSGGAGAFPANGSFIPQRTSSDPQVRAFDGKLYLYTSRDLPPGSTAVGGVYPMNTTYAYAIGPGMTAWQDGGAVLQERQYTWVQGGSNHLWAPDCNRKDGTYYLYVPDVSGGDSLASRIGVSTATSPTGPFTAQGTLAISGYASDPSTFIDSDGKAYLVFANGDYGTCGGLSIARLAADMRSLDPSVTPHELPIAGIPTAGGPCVAKDHAYLEGPQLDHFGADGGGQYFLYFAMKPDDQNSVIAYATAPAPLGPYTYRGIIMGGSATEWTNQASIVRWGSRWLFFYHDSTSSPPQRRVRAECLHFGSDGAIQPIARTAAGLSTCATP